MQVLDDAGSVTIEAALALASLVIVAAGIVGGIATLSAHLAAVDAAGAAARAAAIGVDYQREGVAVTITESSGLVTAEAAVPAPLGTMRAQAVFPAEIGAGRDSGARP
ncbi:hypothetical protein [Corynebacterium minutissimum]|uniref:Putative secreted protein n=1 Tax=Corynebacterium minutissimum TaxID=38301 RepID=A0A2X4UEY8_9CORY|nr:hypothetical protein [Corynebacterium minutissimum]KHO30210.1 hypothetical protein NX84_02310 [Corynebacterium minutissimum]MCG7229750.1 hypothetical protein [Corynebacterium minutissimum]MCG7237490.1 hypothetical protein [Corynebacterium minutissimum]QPS60178.1 hypothetical protein I6G51_02945 [Corynebacterium minutissimum]QQA79032.1 hypothetical protein I6H49_09905 [Corynebacterium minutissimum]